MAEKDTLSCLLGHIIGTPVDINMLIITYFCDVH